MFRTAAGFLMCAALSGPAMAQSSQSMAGVIPGYEPGPLETVLPGLDDRMSAFGAAMERASDEQLGEAERAALMSAAWEEFGDDIAALATAGAGFGIELAGTMIQAMDLQSLIGAALAQAGADAVDAHMAMDLARTDVADD